MDLPATPRTEAAFNGGSVPSEFTRKLEREVNFLCDMLETVMHERNELRYENDRLRRTLTDRPAS